MSISAFGPARQILECGLSRESQSYACISRRHRRQVWRSDGLKGRSLSLNLPVRTICSRAVFQHSSRKVTIFQLLVICVAGQVQTMRSTLLQVYRVHMCLYTIQFGAGLPRVRISWVGRRVLVRWLRGVRAWLLSRL